MDETVAVALITGGFVAFSGVAGQGVAWWLERGRRSHEREMRLLEWKRADRLARLAPIGDFLDGVSRHTLAYHLIPQERSMADLVTNLDAVMAKQAYVYTRTSDERLSSLLKQAIEAVIHLVYAKRDAQQDEAMRLTDQLEEAVRWAWARLQELQSDL